MPKGTHISVKALFYFSVKIYYVVGHSFLKAHTLVEIILIQEAEGAHQPNMMGHN